VRVVLLGVEIKKSIYNAFPPPVAAAVAATGIVARGGPAEGVGAVVDRDVYSKLGWVYPL
jgi:hypothetical protein